MPAEGGDGTRLFLQRVGPLIDFVLGVAYFRVSTGAKTKNKNKTTPFLHYCATQFMLSKTIFNLPRQAWDKQTRQERLRKERRSFFRRDQPASAANGRHRACRTAPGDR